MKKSEELKKKMQEEDNDLKAQGLYNKMKREKRLENIEPYLEKLKAAGFLIEPYNGTKVVIHTHIFGIIDFFPKANKVLIRKDNKWVDNALLWICKQFKI